MQDYDVEKIISLLMKHFKVGTLSELATRLETTQGTVSKWKTQNKTKPLIKKLYELNLYDEIMGQQNIQKVVENSGINAQNNYGSQSGLNEINSIDEATLALFKEAYAKAIKNDLLKQLRVALMEFNDE